MDIKEAIQHCRAVAAGAAAQGKCLECAAEHEQLADWLEELVAYMATKLKPEEINVQFYLLRKYSEAADRIGVKRLRELAQAEKDGRLVVLPLEAKEGDPTPQCFYGSGELCPGLSAPNDDEPIDQCKRCWYCSAGYRQEAEEALRKEAEHG